MSTSSTTQPSKPAPQMPDSPLYQGYFEGLRENQLHIPKCTSCGTLQWPPRELCGNCQGSEFEQHEVPAKGEVYTYSVMYRAFHPWFSDKLPYSVVVVEVADGIRLLGRYVGSDPEEVACGQQMEAVFNEFGPGTDSIAWRRAV